MGKHERMITEGTVKSDWKDKRYHIKSGTYEQAVQTNNYLQKGKAP